MRATSLGSRRTTEKTRVQSKAGRLQNYNSLSDTVIEIWETFRTAVPAAQADWTGAADNAGRLTTKKRYSLETNCSFVWGMTYIVSLREPLVTGFTGEKQRPLYNGIYVAQTTIHRNQQLLKNIPHKLAGRQHLKEVAMVNKYSSHSKLTNR